MAKIYLTTNRNTTGPKTKPTGFGKKFNADSVDSIRFGTAEVVGDKVKSLKVSPEKLAKAEDSSVYGSKSVFAELLKSMQDGVDTVVYIHGYNVSFEEALVAGGNLHKRTSVHPAPPAGWLRRQLTWSTTCCHGFPIASGCCRCPSACAGISAQNPK